MKVVIREMNVSELIQMNKEVKQKNGGVKKVLQWHSSHKYRIVLYPFQVKIKNKDLTNGK